MRLGELAERLGCRLEGDGGVEIDGVRSLEDAGPRDLTFVTEARHLPRLETSRAGAVILTESLPAPNRPALRTPNPHLALARALGVFHQPMPGVPGIHPTAVVSADARVHGTASVGPLCVLAPGAEIGAGTILDAQVFVGGKVRVGRDCRLFPQVTLREGTELGDRVVVHSGTVIGADGFGYARDGVAIRQDPPGRPGGPRGRRRDRRQRGHRSGHARDDPDRAGHEDRQPGADRPQRPGGRGHGDRGPGGDFGKLPYRVARDDCRAGRGDGPRPGRRQRRSSARSPA